jgi:ArsR family transcriptional regulator
VEPGVFFTRCNFPIVLPTYFETFQIMKSAITGTTRKIPADFRRSADVFKALGNPNRLLIVDALGSGERCVADLTKLVGLDMSTVSSHLALLRSVGLVSDERRGTQVFYSLKSRCVLNMFHCLEEFHANSSLRPPPLPLIAHHS